MWESPIYKFKTKINGKKEEIYIDVTRSAPSFSEPGKQLEGTFKVLLNGLKPSDTHVLDFGGGKLRNTLFLLKNKYNVYSCEFHDLFKRSKQANDFLTRCRRYSNFKELIFPNDFLEFNEKCDIVLLINVINIMPVPIERLCVLALLREKMKEQGRLLWYSQHGVYADDKAVTSLFDGIVTGKGRDYHMFYRDFDLDDIHNMLKSTGFSHNKDLKFPMSGSNQAYVFNADGDNLINNTLGLTQLLRKKGKVRLKEVEIKTRWITPKNKKTKSKKVIYNAKVPQKITEFDEINYLKTYLEELQTIKPGKKNASQYHRLIFNIMQFVFENKLGKSEMEEKIADNTQRVDITFRNERERGFFKQLALGYQIICPNIFIECKNYKSDIGNPEFAQIQNRLNKVRGQFGIIVCRDIVNKAKAKERQNNLVHDQKYVLVFTDHDIQKLGKMRLKKKSNDMNTDKKAKFDDIDNYIESKFKEII